MIKMDLRSAIKSEPLKYSFLLDFEEQFLFLSSEMQQQFLLNLQMDLWYSGTGLPQVRLYTPVTS